MHDVLLTPVTCQEAEKTALRIAGIIHKLAMLAIMRNSNTTTPAGAANRKEIKGIIAALADKVKKGEKDGEKAPPDRCVDVKVELDIPDEFLKEATEIAGWTAKPARGAAKAKPPAAKAKPAPGARGRAGPGGRGGGRRSKRSEAADVEKGDGEGEGDEETEHAAAPEKKKRRQCGKQAFDADKVDSN